MKIYFNLMKMFQFIYNTILQLEVAQIQVVQDVFQPIEPYLEAISTFVTARSMHFYFVPLLMLTGVKNYINVLHAGIFSHISIILLKWLFAEDRPYWWIQETEVYSDLTRPNFRQTHLTCETSAGNPSGHVMFTAAIFYVGMTNILYTTNWYRRSGVITKYCIWNIFVAALALVTVSRVYFAAHFLHQCIFGAGLGVLIGYWLQRPDIHRRLTEMSMKKSFSLWIAMLLLATIVFCGHFLLDKDPHWSIRKAFNWCKDPYSIKPETTPIYSLVREFGLYFGLVLCSPLSKRFNVQLDWKWSFPTIVGIVGAYRALFDYIPRWNGILIFYLWSFFANALFVITLLLIVPRLKARQPKRD